MTEINFPVFKIGTDTPSIIGNTILIHSRILDENNKETQFYRVIDDKDIPGNTLAARRLLLTKNGVKLKKLSKAVFFIADLIKLSNRNTWFIDSSGKIFQYKKQKHLKLVFKKIKQVIPINTGGAIIEVEGIPTRFKTLYAPNPANIYAGLLENGFGYILYGTYQERLNNSRRMI